MSMTVKEAIENRYSTRYLDPNKKISNEDIETIVEAGRRAPSGLSTEPWMFYVISGDVTKLQEASFGQAVIGNASHVIALVNYTKEYTDKHPEVFIEKYKRQGYPQEQIDRTVEMIQMFIKDPTQYYREQTMIAGTQMVLQATELSIGSVMVGGYDPEAVAKLLELDTKYYEVSLLIALGYSTDTEKKQRVIRPVEEVVRHITL